MAAQPLRRTSPRDKKEQSGNTEFTADEAALDTPDGERSGESEAIRATARAIAARLAPRVTRAHRGDARGQGDLLTVPFSGSADDLDLDRISEVLLERRPLGVEDIAVRERRRRGSAVVLAVDLSGSMRGERLHVVAAIVGALSELLVHDELAVIAFWSDAAMLARLGQEVTLERLIDELLALRASGLTNVSFPLEISAGELEHTVHRNRRVLLLSDCVHNAGPDPRIAVARIPRLDVLLDVSAQHDRELARDLARAGHGVVVPIASRRDIVPALDRVFET